MKVVESMIFAGPKRSQPTPGFSICICLFVRLYVYLFWSKFGPYTFIKLCIIVTCNLLGQKNHATSWDKKVTQPPNRTKKSCNILGHKKMQPLGIKKIMQPLGTTKNHATSLDKTKLTQPLWKKITQPLGTQKNQATLWDYKE